MATTALKTFGFWIAVASAIAGVLLSQHVIVEGSTLAEIVGWFMTLGGSARAGHQVAANTDLPTT